MVRQRLALSGLACSRCLTPPDFQRWGGSRSASTPHQQTGGKRRGEQECLYATPATALLDETQHTHTRVQRTVMVIGGCEHTRAAIENFRSTVTRRRAEFAMRKDQLTAHTPGSNMTRLKEAETTPDRPSDRRRIVAEQALSRQNHCFRRVRARQQAESSQMARGGTGFPVPQGGE